MDIERRNMTMRELRATEADGAPKIVGYASVFGVWSEDLGGFRERIEPGAFAASLKTSDTRALVNHDPTLVLGRTKSGTLSLREDDTGLWMEVTPPDTSYARDLLASIKRGDIDQMSFGFSVMKDDWAWSGDQIRRSIIEIDQLYDVSPVTYPAYPQTSASVRSRIETLRRQTPGILAETEAVARALELQAKHELMRLRLSLAEFE
jgi:uncharacterized protein